jgi:hypothetical protein
MVFNVFPVWICTQFASIDESPTNHFFKPFCFFGHSSCLFFPSCQSPMLTTHLCFHAFYWINDTHQKKVVNPTTCSWDVKNTHDLINS